MTSSLLLEVPLYGIFCAWLVLLVPAALVCAMRQQWLYFFTGFVTFGLTWFAGAWITLKPARTVVLTGVLAVIIIGFVVARPTPIVGYDARTLQYDVGGFLSFTDECEKRPGGGWTCFNYDDSVSGDVPYRVTVDRWGCWKAERPRGKSGPRYVDPRSSGCLTIWSHTRLFDLVF